MRLGLVPRHALREIGGKPRKHGGVDLDALALHQTDDGNERAFERFVDRRLSFRREARLQMRMKAEGDVCVFGGVLRRLGDLYLVEGLLFFPGTDDIGKFDRIVIEPAPGEFIHAVTADAAIERIGNQHGVVDRRNINSMTREDMHVVFDVLSYLENARIFEKRLQKPDRLFERHLP